MKYLWFILCACSALGATMRIPATLGDRAELFLTSADGNILSTNGQFFSGLGTNNSITSTTKLTMLVTSPGYTSLGASTTVQRVIYGTKQRRLNYPEHTNNQIYLTVGGTVLEDHIAISDYIFDADTIVASAQDGFYAVTNGPSLTNATGFSGLVVTNQSALSYGVHSEPSINWADPGQNRWTGSTATVWLDGGHWSGIAGIRVFANDTNTTNAVWAEHVWGDAAGYGFFHSYYKATIDTTPFTNFSRIRVDFQVFPVVGNVPFDTRSNRWSGLTPLPTSQTNFLDRSNQLTRMAVVQFGAAAGANGVATNTTAQLVDSAHYFGDVKSAFNRIQQSNWAFFGVGEPIGTVVCRANVTNYTGSSAVITNNSSAWSILRNYPGENVVFTNYTDQNIGSTLKLWGDTTGGGSLRTAYLAGPAGTPFRNMPRFWMQNVDIAGDTTQQWFNDSQTALIYLTECRFLSRLGQGIKKASAAHNTSFALVRDCDVGGLNIAGNCAYTAIGVTKHSTTNRLFSWANTETPHTPIPVPAHTIIVDSEFLGSLHPTASFTLGADTNQMHGAWIENVVVEGLTNLQSATWFASTSYSATNVVFKNVTLQGLRNQHFYGLTNLINRPLCRDIDVIYEVKGFANDGPNDNQTSATNTQNIYYNVGSHGNVYLSTTNFPTHSLPDFTGLNSYHPMVIVSTFQTPTNNIKFVRHAAYYGDAGDNLTDGDGDYALLPNNWIFRVKTANMGGWDSKGIPRGRIDPPGYRAAGNPAKGMVW